MNEKEIPLRRKKGGGSPNQNVAGEKGGRAKEKTAPFDGTARGKKKKGGGGLRTGHGPFAPGEKRERGKSFRSGQGPYMGREGGPLGRNAVFLEPPKMAGREGPDIPGFCAAGGGKTGPGETWERGVAEKRKVTARTHQWKKKKGGTFHRCLGERGETQELGEVLLMSRIREGRKKRKKNPIRKHSGGGSKGGGCSQPAFAGPGKKKGCPDGSL